MVDTRLKADRNVDAGTQVVTVAVLGAGSRGRAYGAWVAAHPERARVVMVAEPDPTRRQAFAALHAIPPEKCFESWEECLASGGRADAVLVCLQDAYHVQPTLQALDRGFHVLLEKPMALSEDECRLIADAADKSGRIFGVCHVLRYTPYTRHLRDLLAKGAVGEIVSIEHLEPVGWWHHAHSYVRGSWSHTATSAPMLLAKGCHDLDWLQYLVGDRILRVSSFGRNTHFTSSQAPAGAALRCLECPLQGECAYSATRIYLDGYADGDPLVWPRDVLTSVPTRQAITESLARGPYGRCVYHCHNDVVDHQVVAAEFAGGATGTFTMTAFTPKEDRKTRIFGTQGYLDGDGHRIRHVDFRTGEDQWFTVNAPGPMDAGGGHAGGDAGLMDAFVAAVAADDQSSLSSNAGESLSSHLVVFAAERARQLGTVEHVGH